jgi:hypothetical protein
MRKFGLTAGIGGLAAAALLAACGCGGEGELTGAVSYKGKALQSGTAQIRGADGVVRSAPIDADGRFRVTGLPTGPAAVAVDCRDPRQVEYTKALARGGRGTPGTPGTPAGATPGRLPNFSLIPEMYSDLDRSGLATTVVGGENVFDVELK